MARKYDRIMFGLKLRAVPAQKTLTLTLDKKKYELPFSSRLLKGDGYLFVHLAPQAGIFKVRKRGLMLLTSPADAEKANTAFKSAKRRTRGPQKRMELPAAVKAALKKVPAGYRLAYNGDGTVRLVRSRNRKRTSARKGKKRKK